MNNNKNSNSSDLSIDHINHNLNKTDSKSFSDPYDLINLNLKDSLDSNNFASNQSIHIFNNNFNKATQSKD